MLHLERGHGWSLGLGMPGFPIGLVASGMLSPTGGHLLARRGGNFVASLGALAGALGLVPLTVADQRPAYLACWLLIGGAMSSSLYDPAFATLTRIFGTSARRQITFVTFAGGFASAVGWPATHLLLEHLGWRGTYLTFAAVLACVVAPLNAFALPRTVAVAPLPAVSSSTALPVAPLRPEGWPFTPLVAGFARPRFI